MLTQYLENARRAFMWTSFSPDKRAESICKEYSELLKSDLELIDAQNGDKDHYKTKFIALWLTWLNRKSNCFSMMITGGSNFNHRRHQKANSSEAKACETFHNWREYYFKKLGAKVKPKGVDAELEAARRELDRNFADLNRMKEANKVIKAAKNDEAKEIQGLINLGFKNSEVVDILSPRAPYKKGFESFSLTNCRNRLKRYEERVEMLERKIGQRNEVGNTEFQGEGVKVIINREADRVQIFHDSKPPQAVIIELKKAAFNWSPSNGCWQRKLTQHGLFAAQLVTKIKLT